MMKKISLFAVALAAVFAFASCKNSGKTSANAAENDSVAADSSASDSVRYSGDIPGADGTAMYKLALANDSTDGFTLQISYTKANAKPETYSGKKMVVTQKVNGKDETFYKFALGNDTTNFKVLGDSVLRMVGADLQEAASGLSYDLKLVK